MPMAKATAKPRIGPEPSAKSAIAAISAVRCESTIVASARLKPDSNEAMVERPLRDSSRMRS